MISTPSAADLKSIWGHRSIYPTQGDEAHYMAVELYRHLGLDWKNPAHKAHVDAIVSTHIKPASRHVRMTND